MSLKNARGIFANGRTRRVHLPPLTQSGAVGVIAPMNPYPGRTIIVQTYTGLDIPNSIDADLDPGVIWSAKRGNPFVGTATELGPATGRYNCHGLVFASRRTNIPPAGMPDAVTVDDLLVHDRYEHVQPPVRVGDIVIYRQGNGEIEHTGLVSRIDTLGNQAVIFVRSKWGALEEYEHHERQCSYGDCRIEYWRLKQ